MSGVTASVISRSSVLLGATSTSVQSPMRRHRQRQSSGLRMSHAAMFPRWRNDWPPRLYGYSEYCGILKLLATPRRHG